MERGDREREDMRFGPLKIVPLGWVLELEKMKKKEKGCCGSSLQRIIKK